MTEVKTDQAEQQTAKTEMSAAMPRFASSIQMSAAGDHFVLQFLSTIDEPILLGRFAITPPHLVRFYEMLERQIEKHEELYGPIKQPRARLPKRKVKASKKLKRKPVVRVKKKSTKKKAKASGRSEA